MVEEVKVIAMTRAPPKVNGRKRNPSDSTQPQTVERINTAPSPNYKTSTTNKSHYNHQTVKSSKVTRVRTKAL